MDLNSDWQTEKVQLKWVSGYQSNENQSLFKKKKTK